MDLHSSQRSLRSGMAVKSRIHSTPKPVESNEAKIAKIRAELAEIFEFEIGHFGWNFHCGARLYEALGCGLRYPQTSSQSLWSLLPCGSSTHIFVCSKRQNRRCRLLLPCNH